MDKSSLDLLFKSLTKAGIKTASALKELLTELDSKAETVVKGDTLTARGRISALFDEGTFMETGSYVRRMSDEFGDGANEFEGVICGWGSVAGKLVYCFAQDYSRTKGALSEAHAKKICALYKLAMENGAPVVGIFDSAGALLPEGAKAMAGYGSIMSCVSQASGVIPQIAVIPGVCAGSAAVIAAMFDFIVITDKTGSVSVNAPFVLGDSSVGHSDYAAESGLAAMCAPGDDSAMSAAAKLVAMLPSNNAEGTVEDLTSCDVNSHVDISEYLGGGSVDSLVKAVADDGMFTELYAAYAQEMCVGFAPIGGTVVGVVANRRSVNGGVITAAAARKAARIISFCDAFNIPVVTIADSEGLDVSKEAEASPYAAELGKLAGAYAACRAPMVTVIAGEAYGAAFTVMGSKSIGADVVLALDSAKTGVMNAASAVAFLWNDQISAEMSREDLEAKWNETAASPVFAASAGEIDDIIDSAELRQRIGGAVMMLMSKSKAAPIRRHSNMPL